MEEERTLTHEEILSLTPQRDPIQLVDEAVSLIPGKEVTAVYRVPEDLSVLKGHFPGDPTFPGVYSVEALLQTGNLMILTLDRYKGKTPLVLGLDHVSFRQKIRPGDVLILHAEIVRERKEKAIVFCKGTVSVEGAVATEAEFVMAPR